MDTQCPGAQMNMNILPKAAVGSFPFPFSRLHHSWVNNFSPPNCHNLFIPPVTPSRLPLPNPPLDADPAAESPPSASCSIAALSPAAPVEVTVEAAPWQRSRGGGGGAQLVSLPRRLGNRCQRPLSAVGQSGSDGCQQCWVNSVVIGVSE